MRYPNFDILRLLLAVEVAFVHIWYTYDPNFSWNPYVQAVPAFLSVSGFLVLQSYSETGRWRDFLRKRALRLFPALIFSFCLCWVLLDGPTAYNSVLNWLTGGIYTLPYRANGPLWSLAWEELAYLALAALWAMGAYERPWTLWVLLIISVLVIALANFSPHIMTILFLAPAFFIGNLAFLYRNALLGVNGFFPWIALVVVIVFRLYPEASYLNGALLLILQSFCVVWVGIAGIKIVPFKFPDISYGVYIYHSLIIMWLYGKVEPGNLGVWVAWTTALLIPVCIFSWYVVEKPALALKNRKRHALA